MTPTIQHIKTLFATFNRTYFGNELPEPAFALSNARTVLGQFRCRWESSGLTGRRKASHMEIRISRYFDMPERELQNVLLHEMIHMATAFKGIRDTSPHGKAFRAVMDRLNSRHGWHIRVRTDTRHWQPAAGRQARTFHVLALTTDDGRCFLSVVNRNYINTVEALAKRSKTITSHRWIKSTDDFFCDFPASRSLRARQVSRATFDAMLKGAEKDAGTTA